MTNSIFGVSADPACGIGGRAPTGLLFVGEPGKKSLIIGNYLR